jgi:hypothetical protein
MISAQWAHDEVTKEGDASGEDGGEAAAAAAAGVV